MIHKDKSCIYLTFANDYYRKIITRWRLSCHTLRIETGRYERPFILRKDRVCTLCNVLEDEEHVIFVCPAYHIIRNKYHQLLGINNTIEFILNPKREYITETAKLLYDIESTRKDMNL